MRRTFALDVTLGPVEDHVDPAAPGAVITTELCGSWQHDGPCPLAAHHTSAHRDGAEIRLRVLYATEPHLAGRIPERVRTALAGHWPVRRLATSEPRPAELDHAARLTRD